ncbi:TPA: transposase [Escherichia coli]|nr:transposase [Escherichia coli]EJH0693666.1 transposase [Escherichia coli]HBE4117322.1 transposase [Escherichia coli]HBE6261650.1 transposase [Escherichia coli]HCJ9485784.1 transposase [Escherichia coli]
MNKLCAEWDCAVISKAFRPDHYHLFVSFPHVIVIANAVKVLKWGTARWLFQLFRPIKKRFWGGYLGAASYYVGTAVNVSPRTI